MSEFADRQCEVSACGGEVVKEFKGETEFYIIRSWLCEPHRHVREDQPGLHPKQVDPSRWEVSYRV